MKLPGPSLSGGSIGLRACAAVVMLLAACGHTMVTQFCLISGQFSPNLHRERNRNASKGPFRKRRERLDPLAKVRGSPFPPLLAPMRSPSEKQFYQLRKAKKSLEQRDQERMTLRTKRPC